MELHYFTVLKMLPLSYTVYVFNPLNAKLNPICNLLALLGAQYILHISRLKVNNGLPIIIRPYRIIRLFRPFVRMRITPHSGWLSCHSLQYTAEPDSIKTFYRRITLERILQKQLASRYEFISSIRWVSYRFLWPLYWTKFNSRWGT